VAAHPIDHDRLAAFLGAGMRRYAEQVTAVLGSTLTVWPALTDALLQRFGIERAETQTVRVATEVPTGSGRDTVDLQLLVVNANGSLARRLWIEVKIDDQLAAEQAEKEGRAARDAQLVRYRLALDERDAQRRIEVVPSVLALLALSPTKRDHEQVGAAAAEVVTWQWLADLAAATAVSEWGKRWEQEVGSPQTPAARDAAEALLWFMHHAAPPERRQIPYLGVMGDVPLTPATLAAYREAPDCVASVFGLLERCTPYLLEAGWAVEDEDDLDAQDEEAEADGEERDIWTDVLTDSRSLRSRSSTVWWENEPEAAALLEVAPCGEGPAEEPTAIVTIGFLEPCDTSPSWLEQLAAAKIETDEELDDDNESTGRIESLTLSTPLASVLVDTTLDGQAKSLSVWAVGALQTVSDLPPPQSAP
jgi:hypothetical protein